MFGRVFFLRYSRLYIIVFDREFPRSILLLVLGDHSTNLVIGFKQNLLDNLSFPAALANGQDYAEGAEVWMGNHRC